MKKASFDAVVVGAGFAGLYLIYRLRAAGFSCIALEAADDVGGTWYWNRYPGARCDAPSVEYSYSFDEALQQEWEWTERYATQPEILAYLRHVSVRFDLLRDIRFNTRVTSASYDETSHRWTVGAVDGALFEGRFCIMATGCLSVSRVPALPGIDQFKGPIYHTGQWPHEGADFRGKSVAVIGTGSSGIQVIPEIAKVAKRVTILQRTPNYSLPARNSKLNKDDLAAVKRNYAERRAQARTTRIGLLLEYGTQSAMETSAAEVENELERRWQLGGINFMYAYNDVVRNEQSNERVASFVQQKIASIVRDPAVAKKLTPSSYPIGTKRVCVDTDYYATFNRPNVMLVDLQDEKIQSVTADRLVTDAGEYACDALVCATGFDAMTGALLAMDIDTSGGASLRESWADGPRSYLGLMVAGFPNLFTVTGPGSPSVLSNVVVSIEQHVEWIVDCLVHLRTQNKETIEALPESQDAWVAHVQELASLAMFSKGNSWYIGANIPGKPRVFMPYPGGVGVYREKLREIVHSNYRGFALK